MGFQLRVKIFCLVCSIVLIPLTIGDLTPEVKEGVIPMASQDSSEDGKASKQIYPSFLLPTEILFHSNVTPANLLPLDMKPLQVTPLDFVDDDRLEQNPSKFDTSQGQLEEQIDMENESEVKEAIVEKVEKQGDKQDGQSDDIILELNPNSSDLEFLHTNSTYKQFSPIPNFSAQILTLAYGGMKKPVLIVQPEMSKNKLNTHKNSEENNNNMNSKPMEETSIPTFSIHFPLDTNSQFQIPRYNFTLPTLFLPGLVFTQNENVKTNTHEVHVSFPHSYDLTRPFPPPLDQTEFELLPFNSKDSAIGTQTNNLQEKPVEINESIKIHQTEQMSPVSYSNHSKISLHREEEGDVSRLNETTSTHNLTLDEVTSANFSNPLAMTPPSKNKWKLPSFGQIYNKFFGMGRRGDCAENLGNFPQQERDGKEDVTLCGSDGLCGVTCHRLGFLLGKCVKDDSCVCLLKERQDFGVQLEYFVDKRDRMWQTLHPVEGLCHTSSCRINCERSGYVTGFCDNYCFCGLPWMERFSK